MPGTLISPHDAEQAMLPTLSALFEAERAQEDDDTGSVDLLIAHRDAALDALDEALTLLGVRR